MFSSHIYVQLKLPILSLGTEQNNCNLTLSAEKKQLWVKCAWKALTQLPGRDIRAESPRAKKHFSPAHALQFQCLHSVLNVLLHLMFFCFFSTFLFKAIVFSTVSLWFKLRFVGPGCKFHHVLFIPANLQPVDPSLSCVVHPFAKIARTKIFQWTAKTAHDL